MSQKDDEIIAQYTSGKDAENVRSIAEAFGGIDRVENDEFIFANGTRMDVRPTSLVERWKEENDYRDSLVQQGYLTDSL